MKNKTDESRCCLVVVFCAALLITMAAVLTFFAYIALRKFGEISQEDFKYVVILLIVCVTVFFICGTVIVISVIEACLRRKKLDMLENVLKSNTSVVNDIYKAFADAVSEV